MSREGRKGGGRVGERKSIQLSCPMPGLLTPYKLGTRIEWNPAGKPGPVDVERVGLFRVRVGAGGRREERAEGTMSETTGTVCRDMQDIAQNCDPSRSGRRGGEGESERERELAMRIQRGASIVSQICTPRGAAPRREERRENTSLSVLSLRGEERDRGGGRGTREESERGREISLAARTA